MSQILPFTFVNMNFDFFYLNMTNKIVSLHSSTCMKNIKNYSKIKETFYYYKEYHLSATNVFLSVKQNVFPTFLANFLYDPIRFKPSSKN